MTGPTPRDRARAQAEELGATHRRLAEQHADLEQRSGELHDEVARVHEDLGEHSLLDPEVLRRRARDERERAAVERERADRRR